VDIFETDRKCWVMHACKVPASLFTPIPKAGEKSGHCTTTIHRVRGALNHYTTCGTDFRALMFLLLHFICKYWLCHCVSVAGH
jgi:hypothetical protein